MPSQRPWPSFSWVSKWSHKYISNISARVHLEGRSALCGTICSRRSRTTSSCASPSGHTTLEPSISTVGSPKRGCSFWTPEVLTYFRCRRLHIQNVLLLFENFHIVQHARNRTTWAVCHLDQTLNSHDEGQSKPFCAANSSELGPTGPWGLIKTRHYNTLCRRHPLCIYFGRSRTCVHMASSVVHVDRTRAVTQYLQHDECYKSGGRWSWIDILDSRRHNLD